MKKILVICGPTATGKTGLGLKLAKKFNGEIVSADSRQVYNGMDIITGKDVKNGKWIMDNGKFGHWEIEGVPIWLLDVVKPNQEFSVAHYYDLAWKAIKDIWNRGKLPILVGGTGFYLQTLLDGVETLNIPPNYEMREKLANSSLSYLTNLLKKINIERWEKMNESDRYNSRRLIRALEVTYWQEENNLSSLREKLRKEKAHPQFSTLIIGLTASYPFLYKRIDQRVEERIKNGAEKEISFLLEKGYNFSNSSLGNTIGYREWADYPLYFQAVEIGEKEIASRKKIIQQWKFDEHAYARRQMTWFRKNKKINWFDIDLKGWENGVEKQVVIWYNEKDAKEN